MRMIDIIEKKRDGKELTKEEIRFFVEKYTSGEVKDYQASALLMAIYLNGVTTEETVELTYAMMHSGDVIDLSDIEGIKVDKHSTGGVGDTTTLVLAPLVAACGVPVAKMSGRGLGHTGGTLDKLESIEGFKIEISIEDFIENVNNHKISVIGQTKNIAPADKKLYALRDVTGTVGNIGLIAGSIMSKKLAAGSDAIVLDVKVGSGAFMKNYEDASKLGKAMVDLGSNMKRNTIAVITDMEQPLGFAIGNALEVKEAIDTLKGVGPKDLTDLCILLGANMILLGGGAETFEEAKALILSKLESGEAFEKMKEFVEIQGGNPAVIENPNLLPDASIKYEFVSEWDGYIANMKSDDCGIAAMLLGAGRVNMDSEIDLSAGIVLKKKVGDKIAKGDVLAVLHANDEKKLNDGLEKLKGSYTISTDKVEPLKLVKAVITKDGVQEY